MKQELQIKTERRSLKEGEIMKVSEILTRVLVFGIVDWRKLIING